MLKISPNYLLIEATVLDGVWAVQMNRIFDTIESETSVLPSSLYSDVVCLRRDSNREAFRPRKSSKVSRSIPRIARARVLLARFRLACHRRFHRKHRDAYRRNRLPVRPRRPTKLMSRIVDALRGELPILRSRQRWQRGKQWVHMVVADVVDKCALNRLLQFDHVSFGLHWPQLNRALRRHLCRTLKIETVVHQCVSNDRPSAV